MSDRAVPSLDALLRLCGEAAPAPWYPSVYAREAGISRDSLDPDLEKLRMGGLIHLTEWVQGRGQGYKLTPVGEQVLGSPRALSHLRHKLTDRGWGAIEQ